MEPAQRSPSEPEVLSLLNAFNLISAFIQPEDGQIMRLGWRDIRDTLENLSEDELWLGICTLEEALAQQEGHHNPVQVTMYRLFQTAYEQGVEALR